MLSWVLLELSPTHRCPGDNLCAEQRLIGSGAQEGGRDADEAQGAWLVEWSVARVGWQWGSFWRCIRDSATDKVTGNICTDSGVARKIGATWLLG